MGKVDLRKGANLQPSEEFMGPVSDWSMEDLEVYDWLKYLIFLKLFFQKMPSKNLNLNN